MNITINFGWWLVPAIITAIALVKSLIYVVKREPSGSYDFGVDILLVYCAALVVSLVSWVVYLGLKLFLA